MASFPKVPSEKMRNAVLFQAQQFIPVPDSELVLDYVLCGDIPNSDSPMVNVLLVGGKKGFPRSGYRVGSDGRPQPLAIKTRGFSLRCAAVMAAKPTGKQTLLFADVDCETISMTICRGETILMVRTVPLTAQFSQPAADAHPTQALDEQTDEAIASQVASDISASIRYFATSGTKLSKACVLTGTLGQIEVRRKTHRTASWSGSFRSTNLYPGLDGIDTLQLFSLHQPGASRIGGIADVKLYRLLSAEYRRSFKKPQASGYTKRNCRCGGCAVAAGGSRFHGLNMSVKNSVSDIQAKTLGDALHK